MDIFPKFIIETDDEIGDYLVIAKCTYHKELAIDKTKVKGGGWWELKGNMFILSGDSSDFGKAELEDIKKCIESGNVFTNPYLTHSIADKYDFIYKIGTEIVNLKEK